LPGRIDIGGPRYDAAMSGIVPATGPDPGAAVVTESRAQISAAYGIITLAFAVALDRGVAGASGTSGRVAVAVIFAAILVLFGRAWILMLLRPGRLEVTADEVRYVRRGGKVSALSRQWGDELSFVKVRRGRIWTRGLTVAGTDNVILLGYFPRNAVREACRSRGWHFANLRSLTPAPHCPSPPRLRIARSPYPRLRIARSLTRGSASPVPLTRGSAWPTGPGRSACPPCC
jgi:hypothetical protein